MCFDVFGAETVGNLCKVLAGFVWFEFGAVFQKPQANKAGCHCHATKNKEERCPIASLSEAIEHNENYHQRSNGHDGQNDVNKTTVCDVGDVRYPSGKGCVVGHGTKNCHHAVHKHKHNNHLHHLRLVYVVVTKQRKTCRDDAPNDVAVAHKYLAFANSVGKHATKNCDYRCNNCACRYSSGRCPGLGCDVLLNKG